MSLPGVRSASAGTLTPPASRHRRVPLRARSIRVHGRLGRVPPRIRICLTNGRVGNLKRRQRRIKNPSSVFFCSRPRRRRWLLQSSPTQSGHSINHMNELAVPRWQAVCYEYLAYSDFETASWLLLVDAADNSTTISLLLRSGDAAEDFFMYFPPLCGALAGRRRSA